MPKISQLISATDVTANDLIQIVDVEDGGMAPSGTNKKATASLLAKELAKQPLEPGVVISGSSSSDAVRITQTGTGNALIVEDSTNPDSTPFVVTNQGQVLIGDATTKIGPYGYQRGLQLTNAGTQLTANINNNFGEGITFVKSRGTPSSPHTIVQLGDALGSVAFTGSDGSQYVLGSQIASFVDAVPGSGDMPSCLAFATSTDGTTDAAERMRITSSGNVGIGTGSPSSKLTVNTDTQFDGLVLKNATNTVAYITGNTITNDDGQLSLNSAGVNTATIRANGVSHFNGGDVGIGTSSPLEKLDIAGNIKTIGQVIINAATAAYRFVSFRTNNSTRWDIGVSDDAESGSNAGSNFFLHRFSDASTFLERVVHISRATGNVGIGTSGPQAILHLSSANSGWAGGLMLENTLSNQKFVLSSRTDLASPHRFSISNETRFNEDLSILASNGYVGIGVLNPQYQLQLALDSAAKPSTSTWTVSSDERLKENIEAADLDICYNAVKNIPLKRYKWKDEVYSDEQVSDRSKIGWIAQDVQAVFPKAVGQHKFVYNQVKDDDGNIVSEDSIDDCLSLNSDQLYAAMFGAVQKLILTIETLQDRVNQLEQA